MVRGTQTAPAWTSTSQVKPPNSKDCYRRDCPHAGQNIWGKSPRTSPRFADSDLVHPFSFHLSLMRSSPQAIKSTPPLGNIEVDQAALAELQKHRYSHHPLPNDKEHSLNRTSFCSACSSDFKLLPIMLPHRKRKKNLGGMAHTLKRKTPSSLLHRPLSFLRSATAHIFDHEMFKRFESFNMKLSLPIRRQRICLWKPQSANFVGIPARRQSPNLKLRHLRRYHKRLFFSRRLRAAAILAI